MGFLISPNLPANVVEIGNEITEAKLNEINSGTLALQSWVYSNFATIGSGGGGGGIGEAPSDNNAYIRINSSWQLLSLYDQTGGGGGSFSGGDVSYWLTQGISYNQPYNISAGRILSWDGNNLVWIDPPSGGSGGIGDAPVDGNPYVRINGTWNPMSWYDNTGGGGIGTADISYWLTQSNSYNQPYNISTGRILSWNGSSLEWIDPPSGGGSTDIGMWLTQGNSSSQPWNIAAGRVLGWNGMSLEWVDQSGGGGSVPPSDGNYYLGYYGGWTSAYLVWSMDTYGNWRNFVCI